MENDAGRMRGQADKASGLASQTTDAPVPTELLSYAGEGESKALELETDRVILPEGDHVVDISVLLDEWARSADPVELRALYDRVCSWPETAKRSKALQLLNHHIRRRSGESCLGLSGGT